MLVTARHWTAQYEWYAHRRMATEAGVAPAIIDAIAEGREPEFADDRESLVYRFARTLVKELTVGQELFDEALAALGEVTLVDLVGVLGYYAFVSITLNVFDVDIPDGGVPELKPLAPR